jgi:dihydroorotate dehydrogenase
VDTKSTRLCQNFTREVAGESGKPLFPYMLKLVEDVHRAFPDIAIIACGGIFSGEDAWKAYEKGATLLSLYTALTFYGFGIVRGIHDVLKRKLGSETLQEFIEKRDGHMR